VRWDAPPRSLDAASYDIDSHDPFVHRLPEDAASTTARWETPELRMDRVISVLTLAGKQIAKIRESARIVTTTGAKLVRLIATEPRASPYRYKTEEVRKLITSRLLA
jgi:3-deoxy-D-arabino-heptulosonate 7-phosphate (DAHP) synthase